MAAIDNTDEGALSGPFAFGNGFFQPRPCCIIVSYFIRMRASCFFSVLRAA